MDLSKNNFFVFVDNFAEITGASPSTAGNVRSVCYLVKDCISDTEGADTWDASGIIDTYVTANGIADRTKQSYISRFSGAISKFIAYEKGENVKVKPRRSPVKNTQSQQSESQIKSVKTFELPIPLRDELIVVVSNLPRDLSKEEAKRISTIIESFAVMNPAEDLI